MPYRSPVVLVCCLVTLLTSDFVVGQQETSRRRDRAAGRGRVINENVEIHWVGPEDRYAWYEAERADGETETVVLDLTSGQRLKPADFPAGVPRSLPDDADGRVELTALRRIERSRSSGDETEIEFSNQTDQDVELVWVDPGGQRHAYGTIPAGQTRAQHTFVEHVWLMITGDDVLAATKNTRRQPATFILTPDSRRPTNRMRPNFSRGDRERPGVSGGGSAVFIRDFNVWMRDPAAGDLALTEDGNEREGFRGPIWWSPDRTHFAVQKTRFVSPRIVTVVDSAPDDQLQPKTITYPYPKPGDDLDRPRLCVFSADGQQRVELANEIASNPFEIRDVGWRSDGSAVRFVYNERGHQRLQVIEVSAKDGNCRVLVDEQSDTFIDYAGKYYLRFLDETNELIWMSERDGWNHLYLIDQETGSIKNQITSGAWVVRDVVEFDESQRTMLVAASGVVAGQDPYYLHLLRVSLDGGPPTRLTDGDGEHRWSFSPEKQYFVDRWSRVDLPPVTQIRSLQSGDLIATAAEADASGLLDSGWTMPRRFMAKGRDGQTDIYGIIILPRDFDESQQYPVLELIYAGPQSAHVPKSFGRLDDLHQAAAGADGKPFIVVRIDGMGTSYRSKAFHDVCWKNLGDAGFPDRIAWMKAAAASIPQMDLNRVGVWGGSAGGQNAMRALIAHGDFYKAAFADCGCHDNRMDKIWWNELWMGWPIGPHYEEQSNVTHAHRITGKLMLSVGELDTNVDPASTMQVVDALIKADKEFELLYFPGAGHGAGSSAYGTRRRIDFFCRAFYSN